MTTSTPLYRGSFITFGHVDFALTSFRDIQKIRAHKTAREKSVPIIAANEVVRLNEDAAALVVSDSARKKRKIKSPSGYDEYQNNFNNHDNGGSLMNFSQQQQQQQQHGLILEKHIALESASKKNKATPITAKRLRSSQDENGDLDRFFQSEQHVAALAEGLVDADGHNNIDHQQIRRQRQSRDGSTSNNNSNLLNTRLQQYEDHNRQLQQQVISQARDVKLLQDECRKLTSEKQDDARTIEKERGERNQWMDYGKSMRVESAKLRKVVEEMRRRLDQSQQQLKQANDDGLKKKSVVAVTAASLPSSIEGVVDLTDENEEEIAKLRRVVKQLKSSAEFYKKGNEAKTVQIDNLMQEKSRFEDRVRELEGAQLDGDILQF